MESDYMKSAGDVVRELEKFGVGYLTGEADGLGKRGLFDYSESGRELLSEFFSIAIGIGNNWNSRVGSEKAIGSVLLTWETARQLLCFALVRSKKWEVVVQVTHKPKGAYVSGIHYGSLAAWREYEPLFEKQGLEYTVWRAQGTSGDALRNVHGWSGRVD